MKSALLCLLIVALLWRFCTVRLKFLSMWPDDGAGDPSVRSPVAGALWRRGGEGGKTAAPGWSTESTQRCS